MRDLKCKVINFDKCERIKVKSPTGFVLEYLDIPKILDEVDTIISVPTLKTHASTMVTIGMKNLLGCIPYYQRMVAHRKGIEESIVDVYSYLADRCVVVVDALVALEGPEGPTSGNPVPLGLVVAGNDAVAVDSVCCKIIGFEPRKVKHIRLAEEKDLGTTETQVIGKQIETVQRKFKMPASYMPELAGVFHRVFRKRPYLRDKSKCTGCKRCEEACPEGAIAVDGYPRFDYSKCISCLVCCEMCKCGALDYRIRFGRIHDRILDIFRK